jgi:hypothetical protein
MSYVDVADFQKYSNVFSDTAIQQHYVDAAENIVNNYLGYIPSASNYSQFFNGNGTNELQLKAKPINSISSIYINGASIPITYFYISGEFIYYNALFPVGKGNVEVNYNAGNVVIPEIIILTVLRIAALLQTESDSNIGITSKSFADSGTRSFINTTNFDKYLLQISKYKLIRC